MGLPAGTTNFMYIPEMIFRLIVYAVKQAWLLPQSLVLAIQQKRRQNMRAPSAAERLDRLRHASKYAVR
jgi:hypothetical protein